MGDLCREKDDCLQNTKEYKLLGDEPVALLGFSYQCINRKVRLETKTRSRFGKIL